VLALVQRAREGAIMHAMTRRVWTDHCDQTDETTFPRSSNLVALHINSELVSTFAKNNLPVFNVQLEYNSCHTYIAKVAVQSVAKKNVGTQNDKGRHVRASPATIQ
jgi:hypothetical protein